MGAGLRAAFARHRNIILREPKHENGKKYTDSS
jgi:hypothetical protein